MDGAVALTPRGFAGDAQAARRVHDGPKKAVHHYPRDHHADLRQDLGDLPILDRPGAFGENLSTTGPIKDEVCVGDIYRLGDALIQVS